MLEGNAEALLVFIFKRNETPPKCVKPRQTRRAPPHISPEILDSGLWEPQFAHPGKRDKNSLSHREC